MLMIVCVLSVLTRLLLLGGGRKSSYIIINYAVVYSYAVIPSYLLHRIGFFEFITRLVTRMYCDIYIYGLPDKTMLHLTLFYY